MVISAIYFFLSAIDIRVNSGRLSVGLLGERVSFSGVLCRSEGPAGLGWAGCQVAGRLLAGADAKRITSVLQYSWMYIDFFRLALGERILLSRPDHPGTKVNITSGRDAVGREGQTESRVYGSHGEICMRDGIFTVTFIHGV